MSTLELVVIHENRGETQIHTYPAATSRERLLETLRETLSQAGHSFPPSPASPRPAGERVRAEEGRFALKELLLVAEKPEHRLEVWVGERL